MISRSIICIDLDGTLIPNNSVSLYLSNRLGHGDLIAELEERYRRGEISNAEIADRSAAAFAGCQVNLIEDLLSELPLIDGVAETVDALHTRNCVILLGTITWSFASRYFAKRFGFDRFSGTAMGEENGRLIGRVIRQFDENDKLAFVESTSLSLGIPIARCTAVGDSQSDVPLFRKAGFSIALNATPDARASASIETNTSDLRDLLELITRHLRRAEY